MSLTVRHALLGLWVWFLWVSRTNALLGFVYKSNNKDLAGQNVWVWAQGGPLSTGPAVVADMTLDANGNGITTEAEEKTTGNLFTVLQKLKDDATAGKEQWSATYRVWVTPAGVPVAQAESSAISPQIRMTAVSMNTIYVALGIFAFIVSMVVLKNVMRWRRRNGRKYSLTMATRRKYI